MHEAGPCVFSSPEIKAMAEKAVATVMKTLETVEDDYEDEISKAKHRQPGNLRSTFFLMKLLHSYFY